jgi:hypothetical protein
MPYERSVTENSVGYYETSPPWRSGYQVVGDWSGEVEYEYESVYIPAYSRFYVKFFFQFEYGQNTWENISGEWAEIDRYRTYQTPTSAAIVFEELE